MKMTMKRIQRWSRAAGVVATLAAIVTSSSRGHAQPSGPQQAAPKPTGPQQTAPQPAGPDQAGADQAGADQAGPITAEASQKSDDLFKRGKDYYKDGKVKEAYGSYRAAWDLKRSYDLAANL